MKALVLKNVDLLEEGGVDKLRERCLKGACSSGLLPSRPPVKGSGQRARR